MVFIKSVACFLAIPQGPEFEAVRGAVLGALKMSSVEPLELDDTSANLSPVISDMMESADFVIADVSKQSSNIFYVLGIADSLRKPTLMMAQRQASLQPDLQRRELLLYGAGEESKLAEYLHTWVGNVIERQRQRTVTRR
jgi:hypothetical protein